MTKPKHKFYVIHHCPNCESRYSNQDYLTKCPYCKMLPRDANKKADEARRARYTEKHKKWH